MGNVVLIPYQHRTVVADSRLSKVTGSSAVHFRFRFD